MQAIITLALLALTQSTLAEPLAKKCHAQASELADKVFYETLDQIPNSTSIEGFDTNFRVIHETPEKVTLQTSGDFFDGLSKTFEEQGALIVEMSLDQNCHKINIKTKTIITDFVYLDQPQGPACSLEIALACDDGLIDRCLAFPKATHHQCVPQNLN